MNSLVYKTYVTDEACFKLGGIHYPDLFLLCLMKIFPISSVGSTLKIIKYNLPFVVLLSIFWVFLAKRKIPIIPNIFVVCVT